MRVAASAADDMCSQSEWFGPESVPLRVESQRQSQQKNKDLLSDDAMINKGLHLQSPNWRMIAIYSRPSAASAGSKHVSSAFSFTQVYPIKRRFNPSSSRFSAVVNTLSQRLGAMAAVVVGAPVAFIQEDTLRCVSREALTSGGLNEADLTPSPLFDLLL